MGVPQWNIIVTLITALAGQSQAQLVQSNASFCNWADARGANSSMFFLSLVLIPVMCS